MAETRQRLVGAARERGDAAGGGRPPLTQYLQHRDDECSLREYYANETPGLAVQSLFQIQLGGEFGEHFEIGRAHV